MRSQYLRDAESRTLAETGECVIERPIKPQPWYVEFPPEPVHEFELDKRGGFWRYGAGYWPKNDCMSGNLLVFTSRIVKHSPLGEPGEQKWVREAWRVKHIGPVGSSCIIIEYRDEKTLVVEKDAFGGIRTQWIPDHWRSPAAMPRWASRFIVEILSTEAIQRDGVWYWRARVRRVEA